VTDIKSRSYKARQRARQILILNGFTVTSLADGIFDLVVADDSILKLVKVCLDSVTKAEIDQIKKSPLPHFCGREIWVKKLNSPAFEIIKVKISVNR